jgi:hypothetical protein
MYAARIVRRRVDESSNATRSAVGVRAGHHRFRKQISCAVGCTARVDQIVHSYPSSSTRLRQNLTEISKRLFGRVLDITERDVADLQLAKRSACRCAADSDDFTSSCAYTRNSTASSLRTRLIASAEDKVRAS